MPKPPKTSIKRPGTSKATIKRKAARGLCLYNRCTAARGKKKKYCHKHHQQIFKEKHLIEYLFSTRKFKALSRGIDWQLTLEDFKELIQDSKYLEQPKLGRRKLAIDRIEARNPDGTPAPYNKTNCRIITGYENSRKGYYERTDKTLPPEYRPENILGRPIETEVPF